MIGNPPYGAKISNNEKENYKKYYEASRTAKGLKGSTDTFAVFVNLGYNILCKNGNLAFIIPMAVTSSDSMTSLHNILEKNCDTIKVSSYSNRPTQIFDAACIRTSIFMLNKTYTKNKHIFTTKLLRRRHVDSIKNIIDKLQFIDSKELQLPGRYAKISNDTEKKILQKCFLSNKNIKSFADINGAPFYYRVSGGRYFNVVSDAPTGSTQDKSYAVVSNYSTIIAAILSTNLFWFYQQVYTDGLHIKSTELEAFPLPDLDKVNKATISQINNKYCEYKTDIDKNKINRDFYFEYKIRKSKKLIDELDDLVCPLYGLTKAEVSYIKNYELEFRLGDE